MGNINVSVTVNVEIPHGDIETLIDMAGYGVSYWANTAHDDGERYQVWYNEIEGDSSTEQTRTATYEELANALVEFAATGRGYVAEYAKQYLAERLAGDEYAAGNIDSELADVIVQKVLFGQVIYG